MEWHINDLSISGQFVSSSEFRKTLEPLLQLRQRNPILKERLYCSRKIGMRPVTAIADFRKTITMLQDKNFSRLVLEWISKSGPFWDDEKQYNEDDYFEYKGHDVTEQGLGEVSRRILAGINANAFSITGSSLEFAETPLLIQHGLSEEPIGKIQAVNHWEHTQLEKILESLHSLNCWNDVYSLIKLRFSDLIISQGVLASILETPFSSVVTDRIISLLDILNKLVVESDESGKLSCSGEELLANYFAGSCGVRKPLFKPESPTNKRIFKDDMTFSDPSNVAETIFCHWHGTIQTPQTRIHFEWPRPAGQRKIKVVYIGPKLTKK